MLAGIAWSRRPRGRKTAAATAIALFLFAWPPVAWLASASLERWFPPITTAPQDVDAIVVLASGIHPVDVTQPVPLPDIHTLVRCDRAAWAYRAHPVPVVAAGGPGAYGVTVAGVMQRVLESDGVPRHMVLVEERSTSTYENAANTAAILRPLGIRRIALVTEAFHMLRAERCFRAQGFSVVPLGCAYRTKEVKFSLFPDATSILSNDDALHEWVGLGWYRWKGRI